MNINSLYKISKNAFYQKLQTGRAIVGAKVSPVLLETSLWAVKWASKLAPNFLNPENINFQKDLVPYLEATKFFDYLAMGVYVIRATDGEVVYANDAARSLFKMKTVTAANILDLFTPESVAAAFERINKGNVYDPREELPLTMKKKEGGVEFPVETIPRKVKFADGTYIVGGIKLSMIAAVQNLFEKVATMSTQEEVCRTVIEHAMTLFKIDAASIKIRAQTGEFPPIAQSGLDGEEGVVIDGKPQKVKIYKPRQDVAVKDTATYKAWDTGKTIETPELTEGSSAAYKLGMRSRMVVSLRAAIGTDEKGETIFDKIGAFCIYTRTPDRFKSLQRNIKYLEMFAHVVSHRIREAKLFAQVQQLYAQEQELLIQEQHQKVCKELLNHIAQAINLPLKLQEVLDVLVKESDKMFRELKGPSDIRSGSVYMVVEGTDKLKRMAAIGRAEESEEVKIGDGSVMGTVALTKEAIFVGDAEAYFNHPARKGSFISVPILLGGELLGVLNLAGFEKNAVSKEADGAVVNTLAEMAATAINNAKQHEEIKRLADIDSLIPRLLNQRAGPDALEEQFKDARERKLPYSVIMVDLDHFKTVNDSHGHPVGDKVIRGIGNLIADLAEELDAAVAYRFGGEEFVLGLYDVNKLAAKEIADRLRQKIEDFVLELPSKKIRVTASLGVSSFPENGSGREELIKTADEAMYQAKDRGRNRVVTM